MSLDTRLARHSSWLKPAYYEGPPMPDTPIEELEPTVAHILDDLSGLPAEHVADALAVAFARHCKDKFDAPGLERAYGFVDVTLQDQKLGPIECRVTVFRKVPPVDRIKKHD